MNVALLAIVPLVKHALGESDHDLAVSVDAAAIKGRLHEAALAEPVFALAGQKPVAQEGAQEPRDVVLDEVAVFRDQDLLDIVRMIEEINALGAETEGNDIAILARAAGKECEHVPPERRQVTAQPIPVRPRWVAVGSHARFILPG